MPIAQVNEANIHYELQGQGETVIVLPGFSRDHHHWDFASAALTQHFQVLAFDPRGVGETKDDGRPLTAELMARDVIALARSLGIASAHVLGQGFGGSLAQQVALQAPGLVRRLGLLNTTARWRWPAIGCLRSLLMLRERDNEDFEGMFSVLMPWAYSDQFLRDTAKVSLLHEAFKSAPNPETLEDQRRQLHVLETFDSRATVAEIEAETLVVYGTEDILATPAESHHLRQSLPNSALLGLESGHDILVEMPTALMPSLVTFLQQGARFSFS